MRLSRRWWLFLLGAVFLLCGFTSLVFEALWTRQLANVIEATSATMTCVFSVFVVCLSLDSLLASRFRICGRPALALCGLAELLIGLTSFGLATLLLHRDAWAASWFPYASDQSDMLRQVVATILLIGVPTTLMGTTLPLVVNAVRAAGEGVSIFDSLQAYDDE